MSGTGRTRGRLPRDGHVGQGVARGLQRAPECPGVAPRRGGGCATACVEIRDVTKVYTDLLGRPVGAGVEGMTLAVEPGETLALLGPNGAGKTTTIKMLGGLLLPTRGRISICGFDVARRRREALSRIGVMLGDSRSVYWRLTARENLHYFAAIRGLAGKLLKERIAFVTDALGLDPLLKKRAGDLSRGMCQRLAFAIALLPDPEVLVLDEPTFGLDVASRREMRSLLREISSRRSRTVILATHQMDEAEALADRVCILKGGRVVALETVSALLRRSKTHGDSRAAAGPGLEDVFLRVTSDDASAGR